MKAVKFLFIIISFFIFFTACKNRPYSENHITENLILKSEIKTAKIKTEKPVIIYTEKYIPVKGLISVSPNNKAVISAPAAGFIRQLNYQIGEYVEKGKLLAKVSHQSYIDVQKEFLETKYMLEYYKTDFKRQGELTLENASSIKNMEKSKAYYWALEAKYKALESQLKYMGINPGLIEKNGFTTIIKIYAPVSGLISKADGNIGSYIDNYFILYEIINPDHYQLICDISEKYSEKVKIEDTVFLNNKNYGIINYVSPVVGSNTITFKIIAGLTNIPPFKKPGSIINAFLKFDSIPVLTIEKNAIFSKNEKNYIFLEKENSYEKFLLPDLTVNERKMEIINPEPELINNNVVIKGVDYLYSKMN